VLLGLSSSEVAVEEVAVAKEEVVKEVVVAKEEIVKEVAVAKEEVAKEEGKKMKAPATSSTSWCLLVSRESPPTWSGTAAGFGTPDKAKGPCGPPSTLR
jgi:hypothetical protein